MNGIELPKFTLMSESEPQDEGNYVVIVMDAKTGRVGLDMDYWGSFGWDDFSSDSRFEVLSYIRAFGETHG